VSLKYITKAEIEAKQGEIVRAELAATKMGLENERYPDEIEILKEASGSLNSIL